MGEQNPATSDEQGVRLCLTAKAPPPKRPNVWWKANEPRQSSPTGTTAASPPPKVWRKANEPRQSSPEGSKLTLRGRSSVSTEPPSWAVSRQRVGLERPESGQPPTPSRPEEHAEPACSEEFEDRKSVV